MGISTVEISQGNLQGLQIDIAEHRRRVFPDYLAAGER